MIARVSRVQHLKNRPFCMRAMGGFQASCFDFSSPLLNHDELGAVCVAIDMLGGSLKEMGAHFYLEDQVVSIYEIVGVILQLSGRLSTIEQNMENAQFKVKELRRTMVTQAKMLNGRGCVQMMENHAANLSQMAELWLQLENMPIFIKADGDEAEV
ncbi:hypothetical protein HPP92_006384 [Vanilla planifolia]|uniref:Uncharacterized protein n=1 Tax=Vanilla planifolia TaxID=51239 RepID=A0A835VAW2_VANPL|nr:hypothetical protein HPP92_006384 [Vanilla planifolia]